MKWHHLPAMDFHEAAARILTAAISGASAHRLLELDKSLRTDEAIWSLKILLNKKLIEIGESSVYYTTAEGIKFLELRFNMERMLRVQTSLV